MFLAFIATNGTWIWYESQWEDVTVSQEIDTGEGNAIVSGTGDITYGKSETDGQNTGAQNRW